MRLPSLQLVRAYRLRSRLQRALVRLRIRYRGEERAVSLALETRGDIWMAHTCPSRRSSWHIEKITSAMQRAGEHGPEAL